MTLTSDADVTGLRKRGPWFPVADLSEEELRAFLKPAGQASDVLGEDGPDCEGPEGGESA